MKLSKTLIYSVIIGAGLAALYLVVSPRSDRAISFSRALAREAGKGEGATVRIYELTSFQWDRLYVFGPYTPVSRIDETLGFHWSQAKSTGIDMDDGINLLVFVKDQMVVLFVKLPRNKGDFTQDGLSRPFTTNDAVFTVTRRADGLPMLKPDATSRDRPIRQPR